MTTGKIVGGFFLGLALAGGSYFLFIFLISKSLILALIVGAVAALIGAIYSAIAFSRNIYSTGVLSIIGYFLDMTWSLLNTTASLLVWLPACAISGGRYIPADSNSQRSGTFVYQNNPRGGGYMATTVGTVIAGGWCSHEEVHVWQARMFGPAYLLVYGLDFLLLLLFRLIIGKATDVDKEAYGRICYEDMAYWGGSISGSAINWAGWIGGLFEALLVTCLLLLIVIGISAGILLLWIIGAIGLVIYSFVRVLTPKSS